MKKALVLGVGNAQVDLISYLKDHGWWVIGCSYRHEGRGLEHVDHFELIDIRNTREITHLVRVENVDLVYSIGSDLAMPAVCAVSTELGLPHFTTCEVAQLMNNKIGLRKFLRDHNISPIQFCQAENVKDLEEWQVYPAMLKPSDCQGQRGIYKVQSYEECKKYFDEALEFSNNKTVVLEEYLDGPEISINAFCVKSKLLAAEISDRISLENFPGGIPKSHIYPSRICKNEHLRETINLVEKCIHALGIRNGPSYFQIKLTSKGPRIIEITPRLDGCHLWRLIKLGSGIDLLDVSVKLLTNETYQFQSINTLHKMHSLNFFLCPPDTVFNKSNFRLASSPAFVEYYYKDGEVVQPINNYMEKVGYFIETCER